MQQHLNTFHIFMPLFVHVHIYVFNDYVKWFIVPSNMEQILCKPLVFNQSAMKSFSLNSSKFVSPILIILSTQVESARDLT